MKAEYTQIIINKTELLKNVIRECLHKNVDEVNRERLLVEARFIYFYILRNQEQMVYQDIGDTVRMNHASVLHGFKKAKFWIKTDHEFRNKYLTALASYNREVYGVEKEAETNNLKNKLNKEREEKTKIKIQIKTEKKTGTYYDRLHSLIDEMPEEVSENLLERMESMCSMMLMDLKRVRI